MKESNILAFIGGAVAGAAIALLLAPKKGKDLRHDIKEYVENEVNKGKKRIQDVVDEIMPCGAAEKMK